MVKKHEYAKPVYYCEIINVLRHKGILESNKSSECLLNPEPNCNTCDYRKRFHKHSNWRNTLNLEHHVYYFSHSSGYEMEIV